MSGSKLFDTLKDFSKKENFERHQQMTKKTLKIGGGGGGGGGGGWGFKTALFFTKLSMEFNFLRHQPPMQSERFVHQLPIEFTFPKAQWCKIPHLPTRIG